ncbi:MAG: hypothetical protein KatS3mg052_2221 [Candidatus Roseilinea sp.]|nr:MAG: hypothetical protein KatS3mg052_2221 [Candidatus Roseilinea sp.]
MVFSERRSVSTMACMCGRCTLTTTRRAAALPFGDGVRSVARYACPNDAAATGWGSNSSKTASMGWPNSRSITGNMTLAGAGGTASCRPESSAMICGGSRSTRLLRNWPSLIHTPAQLDGQVAKVARQFDEAIHAPLRHARLTDNLCQDQLPPDEPSNHGCAEPEGFDCARAQCTPIWGRFVSSSGRRGRVSSPFHKRPQLF